VNRGNSLCSIDYFMTQKAVRPSWVVAAGIGCWYFCACLSASHSARLVKRMYVSRALVWVCMGCEVSWSEVIPGPLRSHTPMLAEQPAGTTHQDRPNGLGSDACGLQCTGLSD